MEARVQNFNVEISHEILAPGEQTLPLVLSSPHSGDHYPTAFLAASQLDPLMLRRSEDSFVDELFAAAPRVGAPLLRALFPRAYVDANREPYELDPTMFEDELPDYANTRSPRVAAGLGTIPRIVANGADIYRSKLAFADALSRLRAHYWPYHEALSGLVEATRSQFGYCVLIDCHSMPSVRKHGAKNLAPRVDIVLGDFHGSTCANVVVDTAAHALRALGYRVARNRPYAGGHVTRHYGSPARGIHALQIEINRGLYMDEWQILRGGSMDRVARDMQHLITALAMIDQSLLTD